MSSKYSFEWYQAATTRLRGQCVTIRSFLGRPSWRSRRETVAPAVHRDLPAQRTGSLHEIRLDDGFRILLANALIARHRAQITEAPELMLLRETWDADEWARAEADRLLAHIVAAMKYRMVFHKGAGQRISDAAVP